MILTIGRRVPRNGDKLGGIVISYEVFLRGLNKRDLEYQNIDLNYRNYGNKFWCLVSIYILIFKRILFGNYKMVWFHGTEHEFIIYAPIVVLCCRITKTTVWLRKFGGSFDLYYNMLNWFSKTIMNFTLINSHKVFFQTNYLLDKFKWLNNTEFFPTIRDYLPRSYARNNFGRRFVFISHVKEVKGVNILLKTIQKLSENYTVHFYGAKIDYYPPEDLYDIFIKCYKGSLSSDAVIPTLNKYDVLVLPTYHEGEGYPGIIIEAYSQGIPVITTRWRAIPEIVEDNKTGFLVEPGSVNDLYFAINRFNDSKYIEMSRHVINYYKQFDATKVLDKVIGNNLK